MGKISVKRRRFEIRKKRERKEKIRKLKKRYFSAKNEEEKNRIIEKIKKIVPYLDVEEVLKQEEKSASARSELAEADKKEREGS